MLCILCGNADQPRPAHKSHVAGEISGECSTVSPYDLPFRLLLCLGFATTPSCTVCVFKAAFLLGPAACLVVFLVFKVGGGAESMTGDRVRKGVGDGKLRSTSIRRGTASRQEVEKSSPFYSRKLQWALRAKGMRSTLGS